MVHVHDRCTTSQVRELLAVHRCANRINFGRTRSRCRVHPHVKADIVCFHWVVGYACIVTDELVPCFDERGVLFGLCGHEVVPSSEVTHKVGCIETRKLFFTNREGNHWNILCGYALSRELFVEADVCVTVDGRNHANRLTVSTQCNNVGNDCRPVRLTKWRVVHKDIFGSDTVLLKIALEDVVRGARIHIVSAEQSKLFNAEFFEEVINRRDSLLVRRSTCVEHVLRAFFALVLNWIEQQAVQLFNHWKDRFARNGSPVTEHHVNFVHCKQFARFLGEQWPVRSRVNNNGFKLTSQQTAFGILLFNEHQHGVLKCGLGDGHSAGERVKHTHFDWAVLRHSRARAGKNRKRGNCRNR
mmetsp:Transcript_29484/g.77307  ORF Transcript_29484/g.77307 Transcript_29484/m.77307 type:complete len:357 (+) Transcript_29484:448-1518(+)